MWFETEPTGLEFVDDSPFQLVTEAHIRAKPERVFEIFAKGENQHAWFQDYVGVEWLHPEPHGVGTLRDVKLKLLSARERFLVWEPGKRLTFAVDALTLPLLHRMVEDLQFERTDDEQTRFRWTVHYEPRTLVRLAHPVVRKVFGDMFRASQDGLKRYAEKHPV